MYNLDIPAGKYANGDIFFIQVGFYTREAAEHYAKRVKYGRIEMGGATTFSNMEITEMIDNSLIKEQPLKNPASEADIYACFKEWERNYSMRASESLNLKAAFKAGYMKGAGL